MTLKVEIAVRSLHLDDHKLHHQSIEYLLKEYLQATSQDIPASIKEALAAPAADVLGGFANEHLVAILLGSTVQTLTRHTYLIDDVVCHPQYQRQGIATRMIQVAFAQAKVKGCHRVALTCSRPEAQRFYKKLGFTERDSQLYYWDL